MKTTKILFLLLTVVLFFSGCKTNDPVDNGVTGITLDKSTLALNVGDKGTLTATLAPAGATGTIAWTSSNTAVATVNNGEVTAVAEGTADIVATVNSKTAKCTVTVTKKSGTTGTASLNGTNYYPIILDGVSYAKIQSKVVADLRPDEAKKFLYVWENTYTAGTATGPNFFGEVEGWVSLIVGNVGWSGAGFNVKDLPALDKLAAVTANPAGYYLHIGIKSKNNAVHVIGLDGQSNVKFAIGATAFNDNGTMIQPLADFTRNGEWQEIEIPMTTLKEKGLLYASTNTVDKNVLWFLSGGVAGTTLDLDAVFIYKK